MRVQRYEKRSRITNFWVFNLKDNTEALGAVHDSRHGVASDDGGKDRRGGTVAVSGFGISVIAERRPGTGFDSPTLPDNINS